MPGINNQTIKKWDQQNWFVWLVVQSLLITLLWISSQSSGWLLALSAFAFAFAGLTNYALIHEACHSSLNNNESINRFMGMVAGWLFPVSFSFLKITHVVHHIHNRTDHEMFDYYYPDDNLFIKYSQWYSILIGIYPPIIPLGSVLMALTPWLFWLKPWQTAKSSSIIFNKALFPARVLWQIRMEVALGIVFWWTLSEVLDLDMVSVAILYAAYWFNWSTRQYVTHAFSSRDVVQGAYNLKVSRMMSWIFLNGHWDLVHHNLPKARWQQLPDLGKKSSSSIAYWPQYFKQWTGPKANFEPAPVPLKSPPGEDK